ncbi:MAG: hypothetical protein HY000_28885 [Planctomycetes bacterium]|nr:hypothetical protein [Planctomycetota bacterium]
MPSGGSVTHWIAQIKAGEEWALEKLRQRYWPYMVALADKKLAGIRRAAADEEDVAQEAFWGFYRSLKAGRLPRLENRNQLVALLTIITARKAASLIERENRFKRGAGEVQGESALESLAGSRSDERGIERVPDPGLSPDEQVIAEDAYSHFVNALDENLRNFADLWLAGHSSKEIAQMKSCSVRNVERKIKIFLGEWQRIAEEDASREGD